MAIGPHIRALFGRHEHGIAAAYRAIFVDLDDYAEKMCRWAPDPSRILEVGCGEGAVTEKLAAVFPDAEIVAIDITPRAGRLYRGRQKGVRFMTKTVQELAEDQPARFDLVILSDVLHHVPPSLRGEVITAIGKAMTPAGRFILKDWTRSALPIHWLCHAADRWITGDKVSHLTPAETERLVQDHLPQLHAAEQGWVKPWASNFALVFSR